MAGLYGGGVEQVLLRLAQGFVKYGLKVDLVLVNDKGPAATQIPSQANVINLSSSRALASLPALVSYLRQEQPNAFLSAKDHINVISLWANRLAGVSTSMIISTHINLSRDLQDVRNIKQQCIPVLGRLFYPWADGIVAVSRGVADDLSCVMKIPRQRISVIYNPVITPELLTKFQDPVAHPWFASGQPPVILGVGRLTKQKDFSTLIHAFANVRRQRQVRLMILGEGKDRTGLEALVERLGMKKDVAMPGFVENPYAYMSQARVFVLSSAWEGLPTVLIEALASGTPVVSTDCPSGPREILDNGEYGLLVPVGEVEALAEAILTALDAFQDVSRLQKRAQDFSLESAVSQYLDIFGISVKQGIGSQ
jgi:glycosyltransferase involved in cell wall biosynthesis